MPHGVNALLAVLCALGASPSAAARTPEALFREGLALFEEAAAYRREHPDKRAEIARRFRAAAGAFTAAARDGAVTTEVYTNAANSFFFAGDAGEAVLFYRRALAVDPSNRRARDALEHLRGTLPIQRQRSAVSDLAGALFFWHDAQSFVWRVRVVSILFPAAWILLAFECARKTWPRSRYLLVPVLPFAAAAWAMGYLFRLARPYAIAGLLCLLPALVVLGSILHEAATHQPRSEAVVMLEVEGRKGDGENYSPSHTRPLPPGTEVRIAERRGPWLRVTLRDDSTAWLPERTVRSVTGEV